MASLMTPVLTALEVVTDVLIPYVTARLIDNIAPGDTGKSDSSTSSEPDVSKFLVAVEEEPDTVDFQCTSIHYTVAQNVFDRLVEMENNAHGSAVVLPSLAKEWEILEV